MGLLNFSANFINRKAFLYPSGFAIPKLRNWRILVLIPFCCPITITVSPPSFAKPPTMALSSFTFLSPCNSIKSVHIFSINFSVYGLSGWRLSCTFCQGVTFSVKCFFVSKIRSSNILIVPLASILLFSALVFCNSI